MENLERDRRDFAAGSADRKTGGTGNQPIKNLCPKTLAQEKIKKRNAFKPLSPEGESGLIRDRKDRG